MAYTGTVELISGITPANNQAFPLVDAKDIRVDDETRLDAALSELGAGISGTGDNVTATQAMIADEFSAGVAYSAGDYIVHDGVLYKFTADHPAGAWTGSDASSVDAMGEVSKAVRFDVAQTLTEAQKQTARDNIGAGEVDDTLSVEGMAADAKKTGDELTALKDDLFNKILNTHYLKDKPNITGKIINVNGSWVTLGGYSQSYAIPVKPGEVITVVNAVDSGNCNCAFLNTDVIDGSTTTNILSVKSLSNGNKYTVTVPEGASYFTTNFATRLINEVIIFSLDDALVLENEIREIDATLNGFVNCETSDAITGYYINANTGAIVPDQRYEYLNINVSEGITIKYKTSNVESIAGVAFFDLIGRYVSGIVASNVEQTITVPTNATLAKICYRTDYRNGFSAKIFFNYDLLFGIVNDIRNASKEVVVDIAGNGDYTSILQALKSTSDDVHVRIKKGVYNIVSEYENYYGTDFWNNYDGYSGHPSDPFYRGLWMGNGRKISGEPGVIIQFLYSGDNSSIKTLFSVISNTGNILLENVTIEYDNVRYGIHDDFTPSNATIKFKNIRFIRHSVKNAIGGGMGNNTTYYIEGCIFDAYGNDSGYDINYHASNGRDVNNKCEIYVTNCFGVRKCGFWSNGPSTELSNCYVSNSKFYEIHEYKPNESQQTNVRLIKWCNEENV